ncbi:sulfatase-like hydrolase/transferase [Paenibacillus koleovorans]|uniref:sulfatase-like hydrolase/transferase n=1 Tax=Paenibacillus koleovorans TaxID=121608 RepID=UPI000FD9D09A|nr:sulfatase-like hydrolase/transferase [Paenibacillus koleovorans]
MSSTGKRPNVIVFFTDQQRWDTTGVHGNPLDLTPNFDRMATRGTHLYNTFSMQPVCGPARACMQTGQYATVNGSFRNGIPLSPDAKTIAHYFNDAGYRTGYIGKWHLAPGNKPVPEEYRGGYQEWLASNVLEYTSRAYETTMYDENNEAVQLPGYRADALTDAAIRFIDRNKQDPFFLFVSYVEPHNQNQRDDYPAPESYRGRYTSRWVPPDLAEFRGSAHRHLDGYYGMVKRLDESLGRLQDTLISLKLDKDTILVFTSDHACHFRTRNVEYKRSCHESSIRVPTAICGPGFDSGGQLRELVTLLDIAPTLLDAAGLEVPAHMQGRSVLPLVRRQSADWPDDVLIQISESQVGRAVRTARWKYGVDAPGFDPSKDMYADKYVEQYLYDLESDPYELQNLIGFPSHREVADRLQQRLIRRMTAIGEPEPTIEPAPPVRSGQRQVLDWELEL